MRVSNAEFERRITLCVRCPEYLPPEGRCRQSPESLVDLAFRKEQTCPIGRWEMLVAVESPVIDVGQIATPRGVGTELKKLLASLGLTSQEGCQCNSHAAEMDQKGVEWCRDNRETIVGWLKEEAAKRTWPELMKAAALVIKPHVFKPSISDPFGSLVDEAIRRGEECE